MKGSREVPVVAAVTINFGAPGDTLQCVESLCSVDYPALKIFVVDNGSPPDDRSRLQEGVANHGELILAGDNLGFSGGNNLGIARALDDGVDYVMLINNDATLAADAVGVLVDAARRLDRPGIVGGKVYVANETGPTSELWFAGGRVSRLKAAGYHRGIGELDRGQYDHPGETEFIPGCFWLLPRDVVKTIGPMPEKYFLYGEDVDYCFELRAHGYQLYYEPRAVCYHKVSRSHWEDRRRASPTLNYYTNRNRFHIARKWLNPLERMVFYSYILASRIVLAVTRRDGSYLYGLWDGFLARTGPRP